MTNEKYIRISNRKSISITR